MKFIAILTMLFAAVSGFAAEPCANNPAGCNAASQLNADGSRTRFLPIAKPANALVATSAKLEETDVLSVVNAKLATLPDSTLGNSCANVLVGRECTSTPSCEKFFGGDSCRTHCTSKYENRCTPVVGKLSATPPFQVVEPIKVKIIEPNWNEIPSSVMGYRETYTNCTKVQQSITFRHTETTRTGTRVSKSRTVRTSSKITANVGFKFGDHLSIGSSVDFNKEVSITDGGEESDETTRTLERTDTLLVPAMAEVVFDHKWIRYEVPVKYQGTVVLDAPLSANLEGKNMLSKVFTSPADRTFAFEGYVTSSMLSRGEYKNIQRDLTPSECSGKSEFGQTGEAYGN